MRLVTLVFAALSLVIALQNPLAVPGWTGEDVPRLAQGFLTSDGAGASSFLGWVTGPARQAWAKRTPAERAQAVRDLAAFAKRYIQTAGFEKTYNEWIKESYGAVDHGIQVTPGRTPTEPTQNMQLAEMAAQFSKSFQELSADQLRMMIGMEIDSLKDNDDDAAKANLQKARQIQGMLGSNLSGARKSYVEYMVRKLGIEVAGGDLDAAIRDGNRAIADEEKMRQQESYNRHNLKAELRSRLNTFVDEANSVDFNAQTQLRSGRQMFVNEDYEGKSPTWKMLYRMGREPTMAAVAAAKQWLTELR